MLKKIKQLLTKIPLPLFQNSAPVVAILPLEGVIGSGSRFSSALNLAALEEKIDQAFDVYNVKAVALAVNSPGGSPVQSELIMRRIQKLSEEKEIPVYAFAEDVAASGGYLISLAATEIYAHEASIVGSIGVISAGFGFHKAIEKIGVDRRVYAAGDSKSILDPFQPEKDKDVKLLKDLQKEIHEFFKNLVKERRGDKLKGTQKIMFSGQFWAGKEAVKLGLVDGIGDIHSVMKDKLGDKTKFKRIKEEKGFIKSLLGMAATKPKISDEILSTLEDRSLWARFGL
ncbi:Peptidase, family S49 [hydrothermal vent metagenome]|uniref:Peptidase, family S49 n=1 Tax=hydrothermal vent metagenome TaxID=652676 RepID=A0A3B0RK94_9ZZZZ